MVTLTPNTAKQPGHPAANEPVPSIEECLQTVDAVIGREGGRLGVVMLSGGEPTVRRDIEELVERLLERNITRVMLNTNGRRIVLDDRFAAFLGKHRDRVEVYLQFDGFRLWSLRGLLHPRDRQRQEGHTLLFA